MKGKELTANVVELYQKGWTPTEIGRKLGIVPQTVTTHLKKAGVDHCLRSKYKEIDKNRLESLYHGNVPMDQIGTLFSVGQKTLHKALVFHGIQRRKPIHSLSENDRMLSLKMAEDYRNGMTLVEIGAKYGFSTQTVKIRMKKFAGSDLRRLEAFKKVNREELVHLYVEKNLAIHKIAAKLGFSQPIIHKALEFYNIPQRAGRCGKRISVLRKLQIDDSVEINCSGLKYPLTNLHTISLRIGIKIRVRNQGGGYYRVTRIG